MEELYKKDLNEPGNCDGVDSHPEPDILECEVKWALRSTAVKVDPAHRVVVRISTILRESGWHMVNAQ